MGTPRAFRTFLLAAVILAVAQPVDTLAYDRYSQNKDATNCAACHGGFRTSGYVSRHDNAAWGTSLMSGHNSMMSSDCDACHQASGRFPVLTNSSSGGSLGFSTSGCVGCHGRVSDAGHGSSDGRGVGLRQHHDRSGVTVCRSCHADANTTTPTYTPVAESIEPYNYFTPDASHSNKPTDSCDADGTESYFGATGLDNDGNGLYDAADPACGATPTTTTTLGGGTTTTTTTTTLVGGTTTTTTLIDGTTTTTLDTSTTTTTLLDIDADDDGIPDADDPCNNTGAHDISIKPKVVLKRLDAVAGDDRLLLKGEFVVATAFSDLGTDRLRVIGYRNDGTLAFDIPIPDTATKDEKKIVYRDDAGSSNGILKLQVQDRSKKAPNQVKVLVKGKNGTYPFSVGDEPVRMVVVIGDGSIGDCGETSFGTSQCEFNGAGNAMKCR